MTSCQNRTKLAKTAFVKYDTSTALALRIFSAPKVDLFKKNVHLAF